jgi:hypothetical protein
MTTIFEIPRRIAGIMARWYVAIFFKNFKKTIPTAPLWEGLSLSFPQSGDSWNGYETQFSSIS